MSERYLCTYRLKGFWNCHCARFDDGSCVPPELLEEFNRRRDEASGRWRRTGQEDRSFADRLQYK